MGQELSLALEDPSSEAFQRLIITLTIHADKDNQDCFDYVIDNYRKNIESIMVNNSNNDADNNIAGLELSRVLPYRVDTKVDHDYSRYSYLQSIIDHYKAQEQQQQQQQQQKLDDHDNDSSTAAGGGGGPGGLQQQQQEVLLTGKPKHFCYVDRKLPGQVIRHPFDGHPTNAIVWDKDWASYDGRSEFSLLDRQELSRSVVGDDISRNAPINPHSTATDADPKYYQPITTKAGSRLWSISFVAPPQTSKENTNNNDDASLPNNNVKDLKASIPGQLLVRVDEGRQMLIYDAFEFDGTTTRNMSSATTMQENYNRTGELPCTEDELKAVEYRLHLARQNPNPMFPTDHVPRPLDPNNNSFHERIEHIGFKLLQPLLGIVRFKRSHLYSVRFPLDSIVGARLIKVVNNNIIRPQAETSPLPETQCTLDQLGEYGHDDEDQTGGRALPGTFEACDATIEPLGVLVLELVGPGATLPNLSFSSTICVPINKLDRKRMVLEKDWTPNQSFSRSTRHYIVGDYSEIQELAEFLCHTNLRMKSLLAPHLVVVSSQQQQQQQRSTSAGKAKEDDNTTNHAESSEPNKKRQRSQQLDDHEHIHYETLITANTLSGLVSLLDLEQTRGVQSLTSKISFEILTSNGLLPRDDKPDEATSVSSTLPFRSPKDVNSFLERYCENVDDVNPCFKAGLLNGNLQLPKEFVQTSTSTTTKTSDDDASDFLDHVLAKMKCPSCGTSHSITVRLALTQQDGGSYWDDEGTVNCSGCEEGWVITSLCEGEPSLDCGKYHNHCTECPDFGKCVHDYRTAHCSRCGDHFFQGNSGFPCNCQGKNNPFGYYGETDSDDEEDDDIVSIGSGHGEYFSNRNESGELMHFFDMPAPDTWSGLYLPQPIHPPRSQNQANSGSLDMSNSR